jgi:hypothetical protein
MSAGLPGFGLGGLFFILCALFVGPAVEAVRLVRGRSTRASRRLVGRQFAIALLMVLAIDATLRATGLIPGASDSGAAEGLAGPAIEPIAISAAILGLMLLSVKLLALALRPRPERPLPVTQRIYRAGRRLVLERGG